MSVARVGKVLAAALATAVIGVVVAIPPASADARSACPGAGARVSRSSSVRIALSTLCLMNVERRRHGRRSLSLEPRLATAAGMHARSMVRSGWFAHGSVATRLRNVGYRSPVVGENMAWGIGSLASPRAIMRSWMRSPSHRANILSRRYRAVGIGIARGLPGRRSRRAATYVTDFGSRR